MVRKINLKFKSKPIKIYNNLKHVIENKEQC